MYAVMVSSASTKSHKIMKAVAHSVFLESEGSER